MTKVFISYSWEDEEHKDWVRNLANELLENGIDATLDQYDLSLGDRLPQFMEQSVANADYVLIICTPTYKKKSDARKGGVGYEGHIISGELFEKGNERKFIPVIRKGNVSNALPISLSGKLAIDLKDGPQYGINFQDLVTTLNGISKKPLVKKGAVSGSSSLTKLTETSELSNYEPIHILGIVTDEVTVPRMDGTEGSALYKIPFKLSRNPSLLWRELFLRSWDDPPQFTTMHRFGIASVYGDEIILDGTTIEEVRDYHRATLILCVEIANKEEKGILDAKEREKEREKARKISHFNNVKDIADTIKF